MEIHTDDFADMTEDSLSTSSAASTAQDLNLNDLREILEDVREPTELITRYLRSPLNERVVVDPSSPAGQQVGALLRLKRKPAVGDEHKVGDLLLVVNPLCNAVDVYNVRTGEHTSVNWEVFFPLTIGEDFVCPSVACRCEIETPGLFYAYRFALAGKATFLSGAPISIFAASEPPTPTPTTPQTQTADPSTFEGQTPGAILAIKHKPHDTEDQLGVEVGDHVKFLSASDAPSDAWVIRTLNIRTGGIDNLRWNALFVVGKRETCGCFCEQWGASCKCRYENFEKPKAFAKQNAEKK